MIYQESTWSRNVLAYLSVFIGQCILFDAVTFDNHDIIGLRTKLIKEDEVDIEIFISQLGYWTSPDSMILPNQFEELVEKIITGSVRHRVISSNWISK